MRIMEKLKRVWDPHTDEDKAYQKWDRKTPRQRREQKLAVHIKDHEEPLIVRYIQEDDRVRWASNKGTFDSYLNSWLTERGSRGIRLGSVWYSPEVILRIELVGESKLEEI